MAPSQLLRVFNRLRYCLRRKCFERFSIPRTVRLRQAQTELRFCGERFRKQHIKSEHFVIRTVPRHGFFKMRSKALIMLAKRKTFDVVIEQAHQRILPEKIF